MNYLDLFSGIGGFALALKNCDIKIDKHYFSEIDSNAIKLYQNKFPNAKGLGDVKTIKSFSELGKIDLITFGFPCQDLSVAGKGKGFYGERSSLFYEATRIIRETKPTCFIFENVKGLFSNDRGRTFEKVLQEIADIGLYDCEWQLVNTSWVLPQNRERIFFIGHFRGQSRPKVFPFRENQTKIAEIPKQNINCITARYGTAETNGTFIVKDKQFQKDKINTIGYYTPSKHNAARIVSTNGLAPTVMENHGTITAVLQINKTEKGTRKGHIPMICPILTPDRINKRQNGRRIKENGEPSFTLTTQDRHGIYDGKDIRKLTPLECERLQGFPDNWTMGYSDSQRYKMLGNAVTVPIVELIIKRLYGIKENAKN